MATLPDDQNYPPGVWWRALLTFAYMTGWRLMEPLSLNRSDVDMEAGTATTRHRDNKGKRDEVVPLHPIVIEHLEKLAGFGPVVLPRNYDRTKLWNVFQEIQRAAGIHLPCHDADDHECTDSCHVYGFHDCRRAFATLNAETLSANALQKLMRHRSYQTTQRYINMAGQLKGAVETLHVPEVLRSETG